MLIVRSLCRTHGIAKVIVVQLGIDDFKPVIAQMGWFHTPRHTLPTMKK
jgi:hypothetical protein